jgi:hypothetical protein
MISEKEFANGFGGFWSECLPFLTPQLIGEMNVSHEVLTGSDSKILKPFSSGGDNSQNDFLAETAFELFHKSVKSGKDVLTLAEIPQDGHGGVNRFGGQDGGFLCGSAQRPANHHAAAFQGLRHFGFVLRRYNGRFVPL